jgi:hypothetical protein
MPKEVFDCRLDNHIKGWELKEGTSLTIANIAIVPVGIVWEQPEIFHNEKRAILKVACIGAP